jgi:4-hydroxybenzoate polyprenyltransferase
MNEYINLMRLNKPIGIFLLLWPTLWALWLAGHGKPDIRIVVVFVLGVIIMRSAGCIMNDIADRKVDGLVERTRHRPLATGKINTANALILFFILMSIAFLLVLLLNRFTIFLAIMGALLAVGYPFLKRVTHLPQLGLGLAFAWGVPMAFAALTNAVSAKAWILFVAAVIWPVIYDTMYAMVDRDDDIRVGIKSTAIIWGNADKIMIGLLQSIFLILMIGCGILFHLKTIYFFSLFLVLLFFMYQQWLIKDRNRERCFQAFLNNNWVGMIIFAGIIV